MQESFENLSNNFEQELDILNVISSKNLETEDAFVVLMESLKKEKKNIAEFVGYLERLLSDGSLERQDIDNEFVSNIVSEYKSFFKALNEILDYEYMILNAHSDVGQEPITLSEKKDLIREGTIDILFDLMPLLTFTQYGKALKHILNERQRNLVEYITRSVKGDGSKQEVLDNYDECKKVFRTTENWVANELMNEGFNEPFETRVFRKFVEEALLQGLNVEAFVANLSELGYQEEDMEDSRKMLRFVNWYKNYGGSPMAA